jgi:radical SAM protein with 4Fe4S-binding SPASM domain
VYLKENIYITIMLTKQCNLNCSYCYNFDNSNHQAIDPHRTVEFIQQYLEKLNQPTAPVLNTNKIYIDFFGGEPLLKTNLILEILDGLDELFSASDHPPYQVYYKLPSNMLLATEENLKRLTDKTYRKSPVQVIFSFDGLWTDIQRPQRGNTSVLEQYQAPEFKTLLKYCAPFCHTMIYPTGIKQVSILKNYRWIKDNYNLEPHLTLVRDNGIWDNESVSELFQQLLELYQFILSPMYSGRIPSIFREWIVKNIIYKMKSVSISSCGVLPVSDNSTPSNKLLIGPDNEIYSCNSFMDKKLTVKDYDQAINNPTCQACSIKNVCDKGCLAQIVTNDFVPEENLCNIFKKLNQYALAIISQGTTNTNIKNQLKTIIEMES